MHLNNFKKLIVLLLLVAAVVLFTGCTFVGNNTSGEAPGFLMGIWHGMVAPYTLIIRWFIQIKMYAIANAGWTYDLGFLIGIIFALPLGWLAAIVSVIYFLT